MNLCVPQPPPRVLPERCCFGAPVPGHQALLPPCSHRHRARYTKNRDTLMTMFLQRAMPNHRLRTGENDLTIGIDPTTAQFVSCLAMP